jgi:stress-induced morphogen
MITLEEIKLKIQSGIDTDFVQVIDLRGGDHIQAIIVSKGFENKSLVEQHKTIYNILDKEMKSNVIHALTLKTYSPAQWEKMGGSVKIGVDHQI